jgi:general transcription factor 3C polypeptide 6
MAHRTKPTQHIAESEKKKEEEEQEEEEYVLLDFGSDFSQSTFPPNTPYTLSGLDTLSPILTIGDGLKLDVILLKYWWFNY